MSGLDNTLDSLLGKRSAELLSILRIVSAYMFMLHGTQKMLSFPSEPFRVSRRYSIILTEPRSRFLHRSLIDGSRL